MTKRILSLSLVAVILSVMTFALPEYTACAADTETFDYNSFTVLRITEAEDGTQTAAKVSYNGTTNITFSGTQWLLFKVNVGKGWIVAESTVDSLPKRVNFTKAGTVNAWYIPLTKEAWDDANDDKKLDTKLAQPKDVETALTATEDRGSNGAGSLVFDSTPDASFMNSYDGEFLYFAMQLSGPGSITKSTQTHADGSVKISGEHNFSDAVITWEDGAYTVTTKASKGTAMLIIASFNGETMVDAEVLPVNAETDKENGAISGTVEGLEAGEKVRIYLWNNTTLVPAIGVSEF